MSVIGLRVGPFEIVEGVPVPEKGAWYRAKRAGLTQRQPNSVLVKLLPPDASESARAGLQREFNNLRAVEDPRVPVAVAIYEGIGALAIDAPDGVTFQDILDARRNNTLALTPATLLDLGLEVAETLQHVHHKGRHHGHLSAGLVRVSTSGKITIFGFGPGPDHPPADLWVSPEQARSEVTGPPADQWALAAALAGMITGHEPWADGREAKTGDLTAIVDAVERQWPALARLFRRMLETDPRNRFPSMQPVRQELLALARKAGGHSERRELGKQMARRLDRRIAPDAEVPVELHAVTLPPEAPEEEPERDTPVEPDLEALVEAAVEVVHTEELAITPPVAVSVVHDTKRLPPAQDPPSIPEPPPMAARADTPVPAARVGLANENVRAVAPSVDASNLPAARRSGDPFEDHDEEEDVDDAPTVRFNPMKAKGVMKQLEEDLDDDEDMLEPATVARALAVAPGTDFGGMPTAVPITDVSGAHNIEDLPSSAFSSGPIPITSRPGSTVTLAHDDVNDLRESAAPRPPPSANITRYAPLLVGVMVLLMVVMVIASLL